MRRTFQLLDQCACPVIGVLLRFTAKLDQQPACTLRQHHNIVRLQVLLPHVLDKMGIEAF